MSYIKNVNTGKNELAFDAWGRDFYGWEPVDIDEIPSEEAEKLLVDYEQSGTEDRLVLRCNNEELDAWLVDMEGAEPVYGTDRCALVKA